MQSDRDFLFGYKNCQSQKWFSCHSVLRRCSSITLGYGDDDTCKPSIGTDDIGSKDILRKALFVVDPTRLSYEDVIKVMYMEMILCNAWRRGWELVDGLFARRCVRWNGGAPLPWGTHCIVCIDKYLPLVMQVQWIILQNLFAIAFPLHFCTFSFFNKDQKRKSVFCEKSRFLRIPSVSIPKCIRKSQKIKNVHKNYFMETRL